MLKVIKAAQRLGFTLGEVAVAAGCDDLVACVDQPCCPIPFATIAQTVPDAEPR